MTEKKKRRWVAPAIIAAIILIALVGAAVVLGSMLFGGAVQVDMESVYSNVAGCLPQIILIAIAIVAALVISVAVRKQQEAKRSMIRWQSFFGAVLMIIVAANWICFGPEYTLLTQVLATTKTLSAQTEQQSAQLAEDIADEGIVLLKNEQGGLPLSEGTKLNVFGWGSTQPTYGGTGSGSVDVSTAVSLLDGLKNAGFELNDTLSEFYTDFRADRSIAGMSSVDWTIPQPTMDDYDAAGIFEQAEEFSDTAVIVLTRAGGEGMDLPDVYSSDSTYNKDQQGNDVVYSTQEDDITSDKSYLELTNREEAMVERVVNEFSDVYVIVNSSNAMELGWLDEYDSIKGALWVAGAGASGFTSLGRIMSGEVNPSGRLVDTFVYDLRNTPTSNNYGEFEYTNSDEITGGTGTAKFVNYVESIYVGYKFYETAAVEGLIDYDATVQYPFGYGLSYTTFDKEISDFDYDGSSITMDITVTNTGEVAGKDVQEVYFTPPYTNGGIEKASTNLIDFVKTDLLQPGESQTVTVSFDAEDMASYDDTGYGCYVLERGDYTITLNEDSHTVVDSETITLDDDVIYDDAHDGARSSDEVTAVNRFDQARGEVTYLSRADGFANYAEATAGPTSYEMTDEQMANYQSKYTYDASDYDDPNAEMPTTGADNGLTIRDMTGLEYDDPLWDDLLDELTVDELVTQVVDGGAHTPALESIDSHLTSDTDGPQGFRGIYNDTHGSAFPSAPMLAATWNKDLALERGTQMGNEAAELGITGWWAPAANIHRSAFSGRNFEYYSEDGVLSAVMCEREVTGARSKGLMTFVKHFALNDQETNRTNGICTWTTEQALREVYLKAFESAFKDGDSNAVMTSFNSIGSEWAGSSEALITDVLINEWGFRGAVATDAFDPNADFYMDLNRGIRVGLSKGLTFRAEPERISDTDDPNTVIALREAAHMTLYALANSNAMDMEEGTPAWVIALIAADAAILLVLAGCSYLTVRSYRKEVAEQAD